MGTKAHCGTFTTTTVPIAHSCLKLSKLNVPLPPGFQARDVCWPALQPAKPSRECRQHLADTSRSFPSVSAQHFIMEQEQILQQTACVPRHNRAHAFGMLVWFDQSLYKIKICPARGPPSDNQPPDTTNPDEDFNDVKLPNQLRLN